VSPDVAYLASTGAVRCPKWRHLPTSSSSSEPTMAALGPGRPDLPGCVVLGDTVEEAERQMREAVAFHIEGLRRQGEPVPAPTTVAAVLLTTHAA
jgi:predicted RNase H-like HicB family nuclease